MSIKAGDRVYGAVPGMRSLTSEFGGFAELVGATRDVTLKISGYTHWMSPDLLHRPPLNPWMCLTDSEKRRHYPNYAFSARKPSISTYPLDHQKTFCANSGLSKVFRSSPAKFHVLLSLQTPYGTAEERTWRNMLKTPELTWLLTHTLQGQSVFPETTHICLAVEATGKRVDSIDVLNLKFVKAIALHEAAGTEMLSSITKTSPLAFDKKEMIADFSVSSTVSKDSNQLALNCGCHSSVMNRKFDSHAIIL
ncbi:hypothetical protein GCG54_00015393 [Colletotrichum gloeosporioides]|uniref:PKS/mFAS DH domain-containing protein n=1 Tax=Colletotrichum gloeosporioides TaxID=474922 RepID=A0A8H4FL12_COLGL|nr:uncharacterized protein GCG54_00015393 [Colletotrichum gloeosporioides]KAF3805836.1 hypothetical protein GCG54_00015393 [Colletotrichum gloeosporioides]